MFSRPRPVDMEISCLSLSREFERHSRFWENPLGGAALTFTICELLSAVSLCRPSFLQSKTGLIFQDHEAGRSSEAIVSS